jgi:hypothetical protein
LYTQRTHHFLKATTKALALSVQAVLVPEGGVRLEVVIMRKGRVPFGFTKHIGRKVSRRLQEKATSLRPVMDFIDQRWENDQNKW